MVVRKIVYCKKVSLCLFEKHSHYRFCVLFSLAFYISQDFGIEASRTDLVTLAVYWEFGKRNCTGGCQKTITSSSKLCS